MGKLSFALLLAAYSLVAASSTYGSQKNFRFVTYNVWGLKKPLLKKPERLGHIARLIPDFNADVIGFQETFSKLTSVLEDLRGYPYVVRGPGRAKGKFQGSGLLILSKWPVVRWATHAYRSCSFPNCLENKGAVYARIQVEDFGEVDVFNTHLMAGPPEKKRVGQMRELLRFIETHTDYRPIVVLGDFNSKPGSASYETFRDGGDFRNTHEEYVKTHAGLDETQSNGYSWDALRNLNAYSSVPFFGKNTRDRIDHVWLKDPSFEKSGVEQSRLIFEEPVGGVYLSDHFGVLSELKLETF